MFKFNDNLDFNKIQTSAFGGQFKLQGKSIGDIVSTLIPYFFLVAGILLLINLVMGGLALMLSRGDPKAVQSAQGKITNSLIGFLIVFASYWIVQLVGRVFGIEAITNIFG
jgi:hypothetical protein